MGSCSENQGNWLLWRAKLSGFYAFFQTLRLRFAESSVFLITALISRLCIAVIVFVVFSISFYTTGLGCAGSIVDIFGPRISDHLDSFSLKEKSVLVFS